MTELPEQYRVGYSAAGPPGPPSVMSMTANAQGMVLYESALAGAGR